jgi:parvulin-like peptidyl-prolyl isomerase
MKPKEKKILFRHQSGWILFYVDEVKERELEDKDKMIKKIKSIIKEEKQYNSIDIWIEKLRKKTKIKINEDVLEYIEV